MSSPTAAAPARFFSSCRSQAADRPSAAYQSHCQIARQPLWHAGWWLEAIRLRVVSEINGNPWTGVATANVLDQ